MPQELKVLLVHIHDNYLCYLITKAFRFLRRGDIIFSQEVRILFLKILIKM